MGTSLHSNVQVAACGAATYYVCTTDALPADESIAHARVRCARSDSLRGMEITAASQRRLDVERKRLTRPMTVGDGTTPTGGMAVVGVSPPIEPPHR